MDNDPPQENKQVSENITVTDQVPVTQQNVMQNGPPAMNSEGLSKFKKILKIVLVAQIIFYAFGILVVYMSRNTNDFSGLGAIFPLGLAMILFWIGGVMFAFYILKCRKSKSRVSIGIVVLFLLALSTQVFHSDFYRIADDTKEPYGGYETAMCSDKECMSSHFSKCELAEYTATSTVKEGTPEEAVVTTNYDIHSPVDESHCQIIITSKTETPYKTLEDGTRSKRTLKKQTLYCEVDNSISFEKYAQVVADMPERHNCIGR